MAEYINKKFVAEDMETEVHIKGSGGGGEDFPLADRIGKGTGVQAIIEGAIDHSMTPTVATGRYAHGEGYGARAYGEASHAEGYTSSASGGGSHSEGISCQASGSYSHAEGSESKASGKASHAEGQKTTALGQFSHAEGTGTYTNNDNQHSQGAYNVKDTSNLYADIVGGGSSDSSRKNIEATTWTGDKRLKGDIYIHCNDDSTGGEKLMVIPTPPPLGNYQLISEGGVLSWRTFAS